LDVCGPVGFGHEFGGHAAAAFSAMTKRAKTAMAKKIAPKEIFLITTDCIDIKVGLTLRFRGFKRARMFC